MGRTFLSHSTYVNHTSALRFDLDAVEEYTNYEVVLEQYYAWDGATHRDQGHRPPSVIEGDRLLILNVPYADGNIEVRGYIQPQT